jgi:enamine deaminase RidA (YjgF/YER057c/UK114 family)
MIQQNRFDIRDVIHIQSMSEWAPLCIGPYCQSNKINNCLVFVAG